MNKKISICIPTYEMYGNGTQYLEYNLEKIKNQTYKNFEVVISDHSKNSEIEILCSKYKKYFELNFFKNQENFGNSPYNTNNTIKNCKGDIIKIMFQDDFFYDQNTLKLLIEQFKKGAKWVVTGCNHTQDDGKTFFNFMIPYWNPNIPIGINTISSPSVLSFLNDNPCLFDEDLIMLMDCEFYYQLYKRYGLPTIVSTCLVTNRLHSNQISNRHSTNLMNEIKHIKTKHKII